MKTVERVNYAKIFPWVPEREDPIGDPVWYIALAACSCTTPTCVEGQSAENHRRIYSIRNQVNLGRELAINPPIALAGPIVAVSGSENKVLSIICEAFALSAGQVRYGRSKNDQQL